VDISWLIRKIEKKMATRSTIAIQYEDGTIESVYCHNDGYLSGVGETLLENYTTPEKVEEILALGDHSSLGKRNFFCDLC